MTIRPAFATIRAFGFGMTLDRWEIRIYSLRGPFMRAVGFDGPRPYYYNPNSYRGW